jgi:hypothetical protein
MYLTASDRFGALKMDVSCVRVAWPPMGATRSLRQMGAPAAARAGSLVSFGLTGA